MPHELSHLGDDVATEDKINRYGIKDFLASLINNKKQKAERATTEKRLGKIGTSMGLGHRDTNTPYEEVEADLMAYDATAQRGRRVWDDPRWQAYFEVPGAKEHYLRYSNPTMPKMSAQEDQGFWGGLLNELNNLTRDYPIR